MLGQLKNKFFSIQEGITASVKNFGPASQETSNLNVIGCFDAGDELLDYWQIQWEDIHLAQEQNGRSASRCDRLISGIQERVQKQFEHAINLQTNVSQIPKINQDIEGIMKLIGALESLFSDVEISLLAFEDTLDAKEMQERQLDQRFQIAIYQERRKAEFNELSSRLQGEYHRKKTEFERQQLLINEEKQKLSQMRFEADVRDFKASGRVQKPQASYVVDDADATLESVDLNDEYGHEHLQAFLAEETTELEANNPLGNLDKEIRPLTSLSRTSSEEDSTSTATEKEVETDNIDRHLETLEVEDTVMSRAESIYYTPDATSETLEQLTLQ